MGAALVGVACACAVALGIVPTTTVLPTSFKGTYEARPNETITAAGPLSNVSIRISVPNVTVKGITFLNATTDRVHPATIDASGATNPTIENVTIRGDGSQQAQAIYMEGGSGLVVRGGSCVDPGNDRYFDHCLYLDDTNDFLVENWSGSAAHGAVLYLDRGGSTGVVRNSDLGRGAWNVVAWGPGNNVVLDNVNLHDAIEVDGGRGHAIEAADGGKVTIRNSHIWNAESDGNVPGNPGWRTQGGGAIVDGGGNVFAPPNSTGTASGVGARCDFFAFDAQLARVNDPQAKAALEELKKHMRMIERC